MWPLRPRRMREVVRVGRNRVERWVQRSQGLMLIGHQDMDLSSEHRNDALAKAVSALFKDDEPGIAPSRHVDLVLESAWLPAILLDVGPTLWSTRQVEALLRHRLAQLYDERDDPVSAWSVQLDHRAGDLQGLGYALAPSVRDALAKAAAAAGLRWASLQPAFAWGWQRLKVHHRWRVVLVVERGLAVEHDEAVVLVGVRVQRVLAALRVDLDHDRHQVGLGHQRGGLHLPLAPDPLRDGGDGRRRGGS